MSWVPISLPERRIKKLNVPHGPDSQLTVLGEKYRDHPGTEAGVLGDGIKLDPTAHLVTNVALGTEGLAPRSPLVQLAVSRVIANTLTSPAGQEVQGVAVGTQTDHGAASTFHLQVGNLYLEVRFLCGDRNTWTRQTVSQYDELRPDLTHLICRGPEGLGPLCT